jgi:hypothetical protein
MNPHSRPAPGNGQDPDRLWCRFVAEPQHGLRPAVFARGSPAQQLAQRGSHPYSLPELSPGKPAADRLACYVATSAETAN